MSELLDNNLIQTALHDTAGGDGPGQIIKPSESFTPDRIDIHVSYDMSQGDIWIDVLTILSQTSTEITVAFPAVGTFGWTKSGADIFEGLISFPSPFDNIDNPMPELQAGQEYLLTFRWGYVGLSLQFGYSGNNYSRGYFVTESIFPVYLKYPARDLTFAMYGTPVGLPGAGVGEVTQGAATQSNAGAGGFGGDRPSGYDPDQVWSENQFVDIADATIAVAGGGRWNIQTVFVGKDVIYFEEIS